MCRLNPLGCAGLKQPWSQVFQVAAPRLPFMISAGRFVKYVLDLAFIQRRVETLQSVPMMISFENCIAIPAERILIT